ncbi:MAG: lipopolysaccharide heptosyltransferase II [Planctomycetes bacterium]|nr:lipopolysaccharide heptosyltransferase II [Planctomycetota bacterium]
MNLAVFLPNWIGDAVMATPALRALRQHFRAARLVGVLKPYVAGVLEGGDWFDDVVFANGGPWSQGVPAVAWRLRRKRIDLAVLFPNSFRSALTAWLGGCRRRVGYARSGRSPLLTHALPPLRDAAGRRKPSPVIDAYNLLAERVGCPRPGYRMELFTTPADEARAEEVWQRTGLARFREVVCLNPGAAFGAAKYWPNEHFANLARTLAGARGCGVLVLCGPSERDLCRSIVYWAGHPAVRGLADFPLSLGLTKACIRRADVLVTTDSGPRHFAAAFGRPVVTLFGPTHIAWTETYHRDAIHLQQPVPCGPCQQRVCPEGHHRCMRELLPAEVFAAACQLLDGPARGSTVGRSIA